MTRRTLCLGMAFVLLGVVGCGSSPDSLMKDGIVSINAYADALERGDSIEKIKEKKYLEKMETTLKKLRDLKLSEDERKKLSEKYAAEYEKALKRAQAAYEKRVDELAGALGMPAIPD